MTASKVRCANCKEYVATETAIRTGLVSFCNEGCMYAKQKKARKPRRRPPMDKELHSDIMALDGFACRVCGSDDYLEAHHIKYRSEGGPDETWNLVTLCIDCHIPVVHGNKKFYQPRLLELTRLRDADMIDTNFRVKDVKLDDDNNA